MYGRTETGFRTKTHGLKVPDLLIIMYVTWGK